jgi:hypothetical protein
MSSNSWGGGAATMLLGLPLTKKKGQADWKKDNARKDRSTCWYLNLTFFFPNVFMNLFT